MPLSSPCMTVMSLPWGRLLAFAVGALLLDSHPCGISGTFCRSADLGPLLCSCCPTCTIGWCVACLDPTGLIRCHWYCVAEGFISHSALGAARPVSTVTRVSSVSCARIVGVACLLSALLCSCIVPLCDRCTPCCDGIALLSCVSLAIVLPSGVR